MKKQSACSCAIDDDFGGPFGAGLYVGTTSVRQPIMTSQKRIKRHSAQNCLLAPDRRRGRGKKITQLFLLVRRQ